MVASISGSASTGVAGVLLPPLRREDTLSMAEFNWPILAFNVCLVFCVSQNEALLRYFFSMMKLKLKMLRGELSSKEITKKFSNGRL